ncbi:exodeoxyribonuclease VII large subunit [soil metagenome]
MIVRSPHILSVDHLNAYLRAVLEEDPILNDVWVRGEVTNFHRSAAGHCYFTLSNDGSQMRCALFRNSQRGLLAMPKNGDQVLAHGRVSIYESTGQYQLYVDNVAPEGAGVLQLQFEELRRTLEADGLFAEERKRPLPERPAVIGVVTSAQGAVWHDICNVIARRYPLTHLILAPSAVQGAQAPQELVASIHALQDCGMCDVIIIARGGGSAEDLACFNDEALARTIYASTVPVISAVGHETDVSISDLVADVRAPTPSAAAEMCVPHRRELLADILRQTTFTRDAVVQALRDARHDVNILASALLRCSPDAELSRYRQDIDLLNDKSRLLLDSKIATRRATVTSQIQTAKLLDPRDILRRGYAIVSTEDDVRITSAAAARRVSNLLVTFGDGSVKATTVEKEAS